MMKNSSTPANPPGLIQGLASGAETSLSLARLRLLRYN